MAKAISKSKRRLRIMVSSTVYGIEEMLESIYAFLNVDYEVWMSHRGTVTVYPHQTALDSCLAAVQDCDLFLSVITTRYGSGVLPGELSITHQELLKAIELGKPRWVLAHESIVFARSLFQKFGCRNAEERDKLLNQLGYFTDAKRKELTESHKEILDDFRVLDMYDAAAMMDISIYKYKDRKGNWVQKFRSKEDGELFAFAQFGRYAEVEAYLEEHFGDPAAVEAVIDAGKEGVS